MNENAYVCGVDPGNTTGIFMVHVSTLDLNSGSEVRSDFTSYQLGAEKARDALRLCIQSHPGVIIACERYVITSRTSKLTRQPTALEFIGVTRDLCRDYNVDFKLQMKSDASKLARDAVLKRIGWYQPRQDHANDAARHALLCLASTNQSMFATLMTRGSIVSTGR